MRRYRILGGEAAQVGGAEAGIGLVPVGGLRRDRAGEDRSPVEAAEEEREIGVTGTRRLPGGEERRIAGKDDAVPRHQHDPRIRRVRLRHEVAALGRMADEPAFRIAELVEARAHQAAANRAPMRSIIWARAWCG